MALMCTKCGYRNAAGKMGGRCPACSTPYTAETAQRASASAYAPGGGGKPKPMPNWLRNCLMGVASIAIFSGMVQCNQSANTRAAIEDGQRRAAQRDAIDRIVEAKRVIIGMHADDVRRSWGEPTSINRTIRPDGTLEQWVYRRGNSIAADYVHLVGDVVISIHTSN